MNFQLRTTVHGRAVTYRVAGKGPPIVLVHGLSGSTRWWAYTAPVLARHYRVYMVDLPGFGAMWRQGRHFALREAGRWLLDWMHAVGLRRAHFVGHSMGGYVCMSLAALSPDSVDRLVLADPAGVPSGRTMLGSIIPLLRESLLSSPRLIPIVLTDALRAGPLTLLRAGRAVLSEDVREQLHLVSAPTLLIWGKKDRLVPLTLGYILREEIANCHLLVLKDARHVPMFDRPQDFNRAVLRFLAGQPVGTSC